MAITDKQIADIEKYDKKVNMKLANALYRRLAGALARPDARLVAFGDAKEVARVRNGFIKKTLEVSDRKKADAALEAVATMMKKDRSKSRLTAYYLLAQELRKANKVT